MDALERRCGNGGIRNDQSANWSLSARLGTPRSPEANNERFESIESKLDELRSYLYANRESVRGYAEAYRNGERISTVHVESTVNQLINWRMCKKHQMGWSRAGAQQLLHVKTAIINGRLHRYTGHHSVQADIAA